MSLLLLYAADTAIPDFIFTVKTDNTGDSNNDQFEVPVVPTATFDCVVDWGDGSTPDTITTDNDPAWTHTFPSAGTYQVTISGQFGGVRFNNGAAAPSGGDKDKLISIDNWGTAYAPDQTQGNAFFGCSNLVLNATDAPDLSNVGFNSIGGFFRACTSLTNENFSAWDVAHIDDFQRMFLDCTSFEGNGLPNWDVSSGANFSGMFWDCTSFNQDISGWDMSSATNISQMLQNADAFDQNLAAWDITSVTNAANFMTSATGLSTANYDATLIGWEAQAVQDSIAINFGGSTYTGSSAASTARQALIDDHSWTITDGGAV